MKITPAGTVTTFASGLDSPAGLAFDHAGNLFVVESASGSVVKFTPDGTKSIFASGLAEPLALAFDGAGNLYVTESIGDTGSISKFTSAGVKSAFAPGSNLRGLVFDLSGNLFASSLGPTDLGGTITKYNLDGTGGVFAVAAGPAMAISSSGNLFAGDRPNMSAGIAVFSSDGGRASFTTLVSVPTALAFDSASHLFVSNANTGRIFEFTTAGEKSTFVSGLDQPAFLAFEPVTEKLRNISARGLVGTGDEILIGGFIVGGSALANNSVVARAIGPSLTDGGVGNALQDPVLELHNASGALIASNDNWQDTQKEQIEASGLAPQDTHESALLATLPAGGYTAVVRGAADTTGVALVEVYSVQE